jgi:O-methyltransferase involved in polyketide biosynthesis
MADLGGTRRVIDVDMPATHPWKRRRVEAMMDNLPLPAIYVPTGLTCARLGGVLLAAGCDPARPAFDLAEGLGLYRTDEALRQALYSVPAKSACGSLLAIE